MLVIEIGDTKKVNLSLGNVCVEQKCENSTF